jgi:hypothetical protein
MSNYPPGYIEPESLDEYLERIEKHNEHLNNALSEIRIAVIDCFKKQPVACDGVLMVGVDDYNKLVKAINSATSSKNTDDNRLKNLLHVYFWS